MTLEEYLNEVFQNINNAKSKREARRAVEKAEKVLDQSDIKRSSKKSFWIELYERLNDKSNLKLEKQAASSLSDIVAAAQEVIADNIDKKN